MEESGGSMVGAIEVIGLKQPPPYETLDPETLREKQLAVCSMCSDKEDARYWLTALGLIPDTYPTPPNLPRKGRSTYRRAKKL